MSNLQDRPGFIQHLGPLVEGGTILQRFQACRDPKDDMFLDVAVNGQANTIITDDTDLLALNPFIEIRIVTPAERVDGAGQWTA